MAAAAFARLPNPSSAAPAVTPVSLDALRELTRPVTLSGERLLPVRSDLAALLPGGGFRRGSIVEINAPSLVFVSLAEAVQTGSWAALVGLSTLGLAAAADHGVALERVAVIDAPPADLAATVVAALVDALDLVVLGPGVIARSVDARRLTARARERGAVVLVYGRWPEAADVRLHVTGRSYGGLGQGHGHLARWDVEVSADGRGSAARGRRGRLMLARSPAEEEPESADESVRFGALGDPKRTVSEVTTLVFPAAG